MRRFGVCCLGVLLVGFARAAEPTAALLDESFAAYLNGVKSGSVRMLVREADNAGGKALRATMELELTVRRFNDTARLRMLTGTDETPAGKVVGVSMRQFIGTEQKLEMAGTVRDNFLYVKVSGQMKLERKIPWDDSVVGLYREHRLFQEKQVQPGDRFSYRHFEPVINAVVTVQVAVKDHEEVEANGKKRLLRVETLPDEIQGVQLPKTLMWLDAERQVVRLQTPMPGLGELVLIRGGQAKNLGPTAGVKEPDIGLGQLLALNRKVPDPHGARAVVYRITLPEDKDPRTAFARDGRQQVKGSEGKTVELQVTAVRAPDTEDGEREPGEEFLKSNFFINSDDLRVKECAREAVGDERDPWRKAQRIERWVRRNMRITNYSEAMATADHVAKTRTGDCTEFAMLAAAMCRAVGVPARTAVGLVYVDEPRRGPVLAYHMWTEVWVGRWLALDATLGRGSVGPGHLKIADSSWHDEQSMKPLLPVMRVMLGKPKVEVVQVTGAE